MNEFTKEELEKLLIAVTETKFAECWPMRDKIQSLIDNYCEHEWYNCCCGCDMKNISCQLCDKQLASDEE